jgi:hypothetical protein
MERVAHGSFLKKRRYGGSAGDPIPLKKRGDAPPNGELCEELAETTGLVGTPVTPHSDSESSSEESWTFRRTHQRNHSPRESQNAGKRPPFPRLVSDSSASSDDEAAVLPFEEQSTATLEKAARGQANTNSNEIVNSSILGKHRRQPARNSSDSNSEFIDATNPSVKVQLQRPIIDLESIVRMNEDTLRFRGLSHESGGIRRRSRASSQSHRTAEDILIDR